MIGKPKGGTTFLRGAKDVISRIAGRMFAQPGVRMKTAETHAFNIQSPPESDNTTKSRRMTLD